MMPMLLLLDYVLVVAPIADDVNDVVDASLVIVAFSWLIGCRSGISDTAIATIFEYTCEAAVHDAIRLV
jgi:hypothetical protein